MAKSKKSIPRRFVKLGPLANVFSDPYSRFKIIRNQVLELVTQQEKTSAKIKSAIRGGHLNTATEAEFEAYQETINPLKEVKEKKEEKEEKKEPTLEEILTEKTKAQLLEYYKDTYEVDEGQITAFDKLNHAERVAELLELDAEAKKEAEEKE